MTNRSASRTGKRSTTGNDPGGGQLVAWAGFIFGSLASVAANVLAARIPPPLATPGWEPSIEAQIGAAVWPIALLLSVEVLARVQWPSGWGWRVARYGGVGIVAVCSAVISYGHIHQTLLLWTYSEVGASVGPLVIDGLMVACGFGLLANRHRGAGDDSGDVLVEASQAAGIPVSLASAPTFVYQMFNAADELLYVGITANLTMRLTTHRRHKPWFEEVQETITTRHQTRLEALATEREIIARQTPKYNIQPGSTRDAACGSDGYSPAPPATHLDRARQLVEQADKQGQQIGRPTLIKVLGVTDHQAKMLLKQLRDEQPAGAEHNGHPVLEPAGEQA